MAREAIDKGTQRSALRLHHPARSARRGRRPQDGRAAPAPRHRDRSGDRAAFEVGYATYPAGTVVIPAAQAYRPFLLIMLRPQRYPEVRPSVDGPIIEPYDVASWSLPLTMGVDVIESPEPLVGDLRADHRGRLAAVRPSPSMNPPARSSPPAPTPSTPRSTGCSPTADHRRHAVA